MTSPAFAKAMVRASLRAPGGSDVEPAHLAALHALEHATITADTARTAAATNGAMAPYAVAMRRLSQHFRDLSDEISEHGLSALYGDSTP